jgi:hypothetical protein
MPYAYFRFIAYEIPTATFQTGVVNAPVVCDYPPGVEAPAVARLPVPDDTPDDPRIRLKRLAGVVDLAATRLQTMGDDAYTLKIFVVPEFFFRPPAGMGADYHSYTYPTRVFNSILAALDSMFVHADFTDWLFVPGTIMWNTLLDIKSAPLYRNTLTHIWGGRANSLQVIEKQQPSGIDGMPLVGIPARDTQYKLYHLSWANQKRHVASIGGVPLGYEVCLDHLNSPNCRVLKKVLSNWRAEEGNRQEVSLHILSAGGMGIQPASVAAIDDGYILRNDGLANPGARSELMKVQRYTDSHGIPTTPSNLNGTATLSAAVAADATVAVPAGALTLPAKVGYASFPQRIVFYPTCGLP